MNGAISVTLSPDGENVYTAGEIDDAIAVFSRDQGSVNTTTAFTEDAGAVAVAPKGIVTDIDSSDLDGGTLTLSYSAGVGSKDQLSVRDQGTESGEIGVSDNDVTYSGTTIGTIATDGSDVKDGSNGSDLVINFNSDSSPTAVDALIQNLTYQNTSGDPTLSRIVSLTITDGDGGTTDTKTLEIVVNAENDPPAFNGSDPSLTLHEDASATTINDLLDITDVDSGDTLTWSIETAPTHGTLNGFAAKKTSVGGSITSTGLTYTPRRELRRLR